MATNFYSAFYTNGLIDESEDNVFKATNCAIARIHVEHKLPPTQKAFSRCKKLEKITFPVHARHTIRMHKSNKRIWLGFGFFV